MPVFKSRSEMYNVKDRRKIKKQNLKERHQEIITKCLSLYWILTEDEVSGSENRQIIYLHNNLRIGSSSSSSPQGNRWEPDVPFAHRSLYHRRGTGKMGTSELT